MAGHAVIASQTRSVEAVGAATSYWSDEQSDFVAHVRSVVVVAASFSYWSILHTVRAVHMRSAPEVGAADSYCANFPLHTVFGLHDSDAGVAQVLAAQVEQAVAAAPAYVPAPQTVHCSWFSALVYVPTAQSAQDRVTAPPLALLALE